MAREHPLITGSVLSGGRWAGGGRGLAGAVRTVLSVTFLLRQLEEKRRKDDSPQSLHRGEEWLPEEQISPAHISCLNVYEGALGQGRCLLISSSSHLWSILFEADRLLIFIKDHSVYFWSAVISCTVVPSECEMPAVKHGVVCIISLDVKHTESSAWYESYSYFHFSPSN